MDVKNILVAIDFSKSSDSALGIAESIARNTGAKLHITHVKEPFHIYECNSELTDVPIFASLDDLKKGLHKLHPKDPAIEHDHWLITAEDAPKGILKLALEQHIDLIVMGTHGRTGFSRAVMGSVAEAVSRRATCAVLTIKQPLAAETSAPTTKCEPRTVPQTSE